MLVLHAPSRLFHFVFTILKIGGNLRGVRFLLERSAVRSCLRLLMGIGLLALVLGYHQVQANTLKIGLGADVTSADPHFTNIGPNNAALLHIYEPLTMVNADARLVPGLAESWKATEPTVWEFRLRDGVRFHDGSPLTPADVVASIERSRQMEKSGGQFAQFSKQIINIEVVPPRTLRFRTATPYAMLPYDLNSLMIINQKAQNSTTDDFNTGKAPGGGTGPYRLGQYIKGDRLVLQKREGAYWGGDTSWEQVILRILPDDGTRTAALLSGDVDMIENVPVADAARFRNDARLRVGTKVSWRTIFLHLEQGTDPSPRITSKDGLPLKANPLKDARVRQALSLAINRAGIVERVMQTAALPASNIVSPPIFGHASSITVDPYDVPSAQRLLREAGYEGGFALTLAGPNNRYVNDEQILQAVAQMWARIGVIAKVEPMPMAVYVGKARAGEFPVALLGWGSFSGDLALRTLLATPNPEKGFGGWNWGKFSSPEVDQLLEKGFATTNEKEREASAIRAAQLALGQRAVIPLHHQMASWAMNKDLDYVSRTDEFTLAHFVTKRK